MERPSDLIQSVSRALRVLEVVGARPAGMAPKVVARDAGLHPSTAYHLLRTLAYEGWLVRDDVGDYRLGLAVADRFADLRAALASPAEEMTALREVARVTRCSTFLARVVDGAITITAVAEAPSCPHVEDLIPGFHEGAHATALGKALLSRMSRSARRSYVADHGMRRFTSETVTALDELEPELARPPASLFCERAQFDERVACVARLVPRSDDAFGWSAVGIAGPSGRPWRRREDSLEELDHAVLALTA